MQPKPNLTKQLKINPLQTPKSAGNRMGKKRKRQTKKVVKLESLKQINLDATGIDIGADELFICVSEDRDEQSIRSSGTFTNDLYHGTQVNADDADFSSMLVVAYLRSKSQN